MIICIDIGNTNIKYAIYDKDELKISSRVATDFKKTSDEYGAQLTGMLAARGVSVDEIEGGIVSSVVPSLDYTIDKMCDLYLGIEPLHIAPGLKSGLNIRCDDAREVGADRIVNCVSAIVEYGEGTPMIVVDFGTATTFDVISASGELVGVVIAPGIKTSLESLATKTAQLPMVEIDAPKTVIGKNTKHCMQAGIIFGFAGLVENIIKKIKDELGEKDVKVVATGGLGEIIANEVKAINKVDRTLTLDGLRIIYELNS